MKKQLIFTALGAIFLASCADTWDREYSGVNPQKEGYEYLAEYLPLKEYVDRSKYPNFKLGIATTASEYTQQQLVYALVNSNADETVAGNAMKMASCVDDKGNMSFDNAVAFASAATDAGLNVYGHTLAWHAQQPNKFLNGLLKDKELDVDPDATQLVNQLTNSEMKEGASMANFVVREAGKGDVQGPIFSGGPEGLNYTQITSIDNPANTWDTQFFIYTPDKTWAGGEKYHISFWYKASAEADCESQCHGTPGGYKHWAMLPQNPHFTTEWQFYEATATIPAEGDGMQSIAFNLNVNKSAVTYCFANIKWETEEAMAVEVEVDATEKTYTDGKFPFYAMGCEPPVINGAIHFVPTGDWSQFFIFPGGENNLEEGDYVAYLDMTSSETVGGVQLTIQNGWGGDAQNITVPISVEAGQHVYKLKFPGVVGGAFDVILKPQTAMATLDVKSITFKKVMKLNSIPLTPEEKRDTLIWAMDRWIGGMMQAMEGKVKAWDVVNEAISGGNADAEGVYALQSASNVSAEDAKNNFYWQDYMGELDYVRTAVASARKHFEANGGNPSELKLFVNDYNLESDWDQNGKLKSLIKWIERWEADGVTKIDGIGSQMHVSFHANPDIQASKEKAIVESFKLMADSKKLVRISELDMGYKDANNTTVTTANLTEEQQKQMAEFYNFIVTKYLELVPAAQQWGICQWAATDSPAGSGWRAGEPIGLWDEGYNRKHTYAGFADGLAGK